MQGQRIGYIRVSSFDQNPERQLEQVEVGRVFTDKASGKDTLRPDLDSLLAFVREGDTVVVHSMDRLARNLDDLRRLVQKLATQFRAMPYRLSIVGHTSATRTPPRPGYGPWDLSADRANAIRQVLEESGVPSSHIFMVAGRADTQPLFPDDPHMAANRRVTLTLMREAPPIPADLKP